MDSCIQNEHSHNILEALLREIIMFNLFDKRTRAPSAPIERIEDIPEFWPGTACIPVTLVRLSRKDMALNQALLIHRCYRYDEAKIRKQIDNGTALTDNGKCCYIKEGIQAFRETLRDQEESLVNNPHRAYHLLFDIVDSGDIVQLEILVKSLSLPVNLYDTSSKEQLQCVIPDVIMHTKIMQLFNEQLTETEETKRANRLALQLLKSKAKVQI